MCIEISAASFFVPSFASPDSKWLLVKLIREYRSPARKERLCDQKKSSAGMSKLLHAYDSIQQIFTILVPAPTSVFLSQRQARRGNDFAEVEVINA